MRASIVIVSYNGRHLLGPCLEATLPQAKAEAAEVIVVDNGSIDGTADLVRERFPSVRLVLTARNLGFAEGCNVGVRAAGSDRIVILNNDAIPDAGWLPELLAALEPSDVAIACSVVHDPRFPEAYALGTGSLSVIGHPISNVIPDLAHPFYATGCSLAFKRELMGEPFHTAFFAYYEDALLAWRAHLNGYRVARALNSSVQHLGSVTALRMPDLTTYYYERNKLLTLLLAYRSITLVKLMPLYAFDGIVRLVEDVWLGMKAPGHAARAISRYRLILRALTWLLVNRRIIAREHISIQRARRVGDDDITTLLSAKIYDDYTPTRAHELVNRLSRLYCRLAGIPTAESTTRSSKPSC